MLGAIPIGTPSGRLTPAHAGGMQHRCVICAAAPSRSSSRAEVTRDLWSALTTQFRRDTVPALQELVQPLLEGPPAPLTDTVSPQQLADSDSRFMEVDGVTLHYKERGPTHPNAPVVVLLHGFNGSTFNWRTNLEPLAAATEEGVRVVAIDRPPFGLSQRPRTWEGGEQGSPYTNEGAARLTLGLLDQLQARGPIILVGHSAGALVAMETFKRRAQAVAGFVFVAPALPNNEASDSWIYRASLTQQLRRLWTRALLQTDGPGLHFVRRQLRERREEVRRGKLGIYHESEATQDVIDGYIRPMQSHDWDWGSLLSFRTFGWPSSMPYHTMTQPVLFIQGRRDEPLRSGALKVADLLRKRAEGSTDWEEFEDCGHVPMDEYPAKFNQTIVPFIAKTFSQASQLPSLDRLASDDPVPSLPVFPASEVTPVKQI